MDGVILYFVEPRSLSFSIIFQIKMLEFTEFLQILSDFSLA